MNRWISNKFLFVYKYSGKWISKLINQRKRKANRRYRILLYCNSSTMEEHLLNYMEHIEGPKYKFFVFFGDSYADGSRHLLENTLFKEKDIVPLRHLWQLFTGWWDLIVCADLELPFWMFKGIVPALYIGHGVSNVSYDSGANVYDFGPECYDDNGELLFDKMLEPNKRVADLLKEKDDKFKDVICRTGYRFSGRIKEESEKGRFYKEQLGICDEKPVVSFFGSWNKESLFHVLGEELFEVCDSLKKKYTFIYSVHPIEYREYNKDIKPMGPLVEQQRDRGFIVRSPKENWIPYIMASDVVVVDYSTMMSLAVLAEKKVILSDFPDTKIGVYSLGYQLKRQVPVLSDAHDLEEALKQVLYVPAFEQIIERFRQELYVPSEEYKNTVRQITEDLVTGR